MDSLGRALRGLVSGLVSVLGGGVRRNAMTCSLYRLLRRLKKRGPLPLSSIQHLLPPTVAPSRGSS